MALAVGQVSIGDLVMGEGTAYRLPGFNPWARTVRAIQSAPRAWGHGSWSGAEWSDEVVVPMQILVEAVGLGGWQAAHQLLLAAFAPSADDVELRWNLDGTEYVMFGRPRMVEPEVRTIALGWAMTHAAFVALDPHVYSGVEHSDTLGLPSSVGGLTVPVTVPFSIPAVVTSGRVMLTNAGTADVGLKLRVDGPVSEPRVSLLSTAGTAVLRLFMDVEVGQWLDIDTGARTVYLNGVASRRGLAAVSGAGWPVLPTGESELAFDAALFDPLAQLTVRWRDAWH